MKKQMLKKSEVLREGYIKGLKKAQRIITEMMENETESETFPREKVETAWDNTRCHYDGWLRRYNIQKAAQLATKKFFSYYGEEFKNKQLQQKYYDEVYKFFKNDLEYWFRDGDVDGLETLFGYEF